MSSDSLSSAKQYALRLIKFRVRSEKEVRDKLKARDYDIAIVSQVIEFLKKSKFLDDALFAKLWVESRIKMSIGLRRLNHELKKKGIDKEIIERALSAVSEDYDEEGVIKKIIESKLKKMQGIETIKIKSRLYGFLLRRGYSQNKIYSVLQDIIKSDDEDDQT